MLKRLGVPWIERNLAATIQLKSTYTQSMLLPVTVLAATAQNLGAQDIEPRAHTNIPVGISMGRGVWGALDADYYIGGQTTRDGVTSDNSQVNWRLGATLAFPVDRRNSIKLFGSTGVYSRTGSNFSSVGIAWQYRWGRGL